MSPKSDMNVIRGQVVKIYACHAEESLIASEWSLIASEINQSLSVLSFIPEKFPWSHLVYE